MEGRISILVITVLFLSSMASANWSIEDVEQPYSLDKIDVDQHSGQIIRVLDSSDDPVDPARLESTVWDLTMKYNTSSYDMDYLGNGYWYKLLNVSEDDNYLVEYELRDTAPDGGEINQTETLDEGNLGIELHNELKRQYKTGSQILLETNVTNENNGQIADNSNLLVNAYFTDGEEVYNMVELGQRDRDGLYTNVISVPSRHNQTFVLHVNASSSSVSNGYASVSEHTTTFPSKLGRFENLKTSNSKCNNESFFSSCERDADIDAHFNATVFPADAAEFELFSERNGGSWSRIQSMDMENDSGLWKTNFDFPDINTSTKSSKAIMRINASIENSFFYLTRNISSRSFKIRDKSEPATYPGRSYRVEVAFVKYFSLKPINGTRISNAYVEVHQPNGTLLENITYSEMDYSTSDKLFYSDINIPSDAEQGSYSLDIHARNINGESKSLDSGFSVEDAEASFSVTEGDLSFDINQTGVYTREMVVENRVGENRTLDVYLEGDIDNFTTVNAGQAIEIAESEAKNVPVDFDVSSLGSYTGDIILSDSKANYNRTVDVNIQTPDCSIEDGDLCLITENKWLNITSLEVGYTSQDVTLLYLGEESSFVDVYSNGDISQYLEISPVSFTLEGSQAVNLNYSAEDEGTFIGNITFSSQDDQLGLNTKLFSRAERRDPGIAAPSSLTIGEVPSGENIERTLYINNTGELQIDSLSASSNTFEPYISSGSIPVGQNKTFTLELRGVRSSYGTVSISGRTSKGWVNSSISISGDIVTRRDVSSLEADIESLREEVDTTSADSRLDNLEDSLSDIREMYDDGDYQSANEEYARVSSELNELEQQYSSSTGGSSGTPGGSTGGGQSSPEPTDPGSTDSGGGLLVPIAVVLFVFILVGFVFYTSYVPEEGDPLYDLMGNQQ